MKLFLSVVLCLLMFSCSNPTVDVGDSSGFSPPKQLVASLVEGRVTVHAAASGEMITVDAETLAQLNDLFLNRDISDIEFEWTQPGNERSTGTIHHFVAGTGKFLTSHQVAVRRNDGSGYMDYYTCYVVGYTYYCSDCGIKGNTYTTHSVPHL